MKRRRKSRNDSIRQNKKISMLNKLLFDSYCCTNGTLVGDCVSALDRFVDELSDLRSTVDVGSTLVCSMGVVVGASIFASIF